MQARMRRRRRVVGALVGPQWRVSGQRGGIDNGRA
jgi:hypothetical protein